MITIAGKYNTAKVFSDEMDNSAQGQIQKLCDMPFSAGSVIRMMPDVHAGSGCAIGTTMTIRDKVVPNLVGVDIGCGMETVQLEETRINLPKLDSYIHDKIPAGFNIQERPHRYYDEIEETLASLKCVKHIDLHRAALSIGTLGGGNHFIEVDKDDEGILYLVIHSGSRHIGLQVAEHYQKAGFQALSINIEDEIPYALAYVEGELLDNYLHDMKIMQEYAALNRCAIADDIVRGMKLHEVDRFTTTHNYIDIENLILRKGAVSAQLGERLLIPINMRDGSLICEGLGNPDWNHSAPHGAGRLMSRTDAKQSFTVSAFKSEMEGVFSTTIGSETLDECPMAYKSMDDIVKHIAPTVKIVKHIHTVYNFKSGENGVQKKRHHR